MVEGIALVDERVGGVVAKIFIYVNEEHPLNAEAPMLVSEAGKAISVREEQPLKNSLLIFVT